MESAKILNFGLLVKCNIGSKNQQCYGDLVYKVEKTNFSTQWHRLPPFYGGGYVFVDSLFIFAPIVCGGSVIGPCFVIQYFICI